ncbi:hypothetical protein IU402_07095 [Aerococcaceae bacterium zg-BR9]|nr:hypothetical protein [Aerococcaceae bacterium zg-BR9]
MPGCYRHLRVPLHATLEELSETILDEFEFMNDHAHAFFMNNRPWTNDDCYYMAMVDDEERYRHTRDYTVDVLAIKQKFIYVFDFDEEWRFRCQVLREIDSAPREEYFGRAYTDVVKAVGEPPRKYPDWDDEEECIDT